MLTNTEHLKLLHAIYKHAGVPFQIQLSGVHSCLQWRVSVEEQGEHVYTHFR